MKIRNISHYLPYIFGLLLNISEIFLLFLAFIMKMYYFALRILTEKFYPNDLK